MPSSVAGQMPLWLQVHEKLLSPLQKCMGRNNGSTSTCPADVTYVQRMLLKNITFEGLHSVNCGDISIDTCQRILWRLRCPTDSGKYWLDTPTAVLCRNFYSTVPFSTRSRFLHVVFWQENGHVLVFEYVFECSFYSGGDDASWLPKVFTWWSPLLDVWQSFHNGLPHF